MTKLIINNTLSINNSVFLKPMNKIVLFHFNFLPTCEAKLKSDQQLLPAADINFANSLEPNQAIVRPARSGSKL